ncbi:zinc finger, CCHC-type containing protein [Tanacetum coccineum]|uniref:Zinc finger, CCHC-type containing protein n=1 Tax=Tanacetum coccineum TaxID=301880 RepID=A0ABQ5B6H5_9ASTR
MPGVGHVELFAEDARPCPSGLANDRFTPLERPNIVRLRFTQHKMNMDEAIQVSCIIDKLPPSWKDFKHTLKHKKEELTLVEFGSHLRIEESLRALNIVNNNIASAFMSTSKLNDSILWHARLGHVYFKRMQDMSKDALILAFDMDTESLIHSYLCDLHATPLLGNKKYFMTFIDEASRPVVRLPDPKLNTLGERGIECIFVGYAEHSKVFMFYVIKPNDSVSINSIIESMDAIFDENRFSSVLGPSLIIPNGTKDIGGSVVLKEVTKESQDVAFWKEAINDEMDSIMCNNTWMLADLPLGCKPLGCKWTFKRKLKVYGTIEKFKARLVIQGFKQKSGIDYFDTYAPVACISTIILLIAMASIHNLIIHQMDVKIAFLNGDLDEEVLYEGHGEADVILGIRIKHESNGIGISQSHYIEKVLKKFNYFDCTPVSTPMDTSEKVMPNNGQAVSQLEYSRVIGYLMYSMTCTKPDIAFVVGKLSRYTSNPGTQHWQKIQRVLKYLKKTMDYRLTYNGYPSVLEGYTDASWISNTEDNSSISGWVFLLGGGAISWASKKQTCITGSTIESKFMALAAAGKEAEWLRNLILKILFWSKTTSPISISCDSATTLAKTYSQMYNRKSIHLGVRHNMIRELITNGVVSIEFVRSQQNLDDYLTKDIQLPTEETWMCLEPAEKEDEVVNFLMVNFFEKVLSMNKEEPPMVRTGRIDKLSMLLLGPFIENWSCIYRDASRVSFHRENVIQRPVKGSPRGGHPGETRMTCVVSCLVMLRSRVAP